MIRAINGKVRFLYENSLFLIGGAVVALVWANWDPHGYHELIHLQMVSGWHDANLHFIVNDFLMALFFAIAAKEVRESFLPGGSLSSLQKAAMPLIATLGGIVVPAGLYLMIAWTTGRFDSLAQGWAIPCATDIAFSYLVARLIFGNGHPAIAFLLLLAIADDAIGLCIIAVAYPQGALVFEWLFLSVAGIALALMFHRAWKLHSFWWYLLIPGLMSWIGFYKCGIHPALGLVPIIPCMPHGHTDLGMYAREELERHDTLNEFEHWWSNPVELILGLFGLLNAGVALSSFGVGTWAVLVGLLVGKPVGIALFALIGEYALKLQRPVGMRASHLWVVGSVAGIGFTVALFVSGAAFPVAGPVKDSVKMGALASFGSAVIAFLFAWMFNIRRQRDEGSEYSVEEQSEPKYV